MNFRKILLTLHLVVGLIAAVFLILLGGSGALLVFEGEIDRVLNPRLTVVQPVGERLSLNALAARLEETHPGGKVASLHLPARDDLAVKTSLRQGPATVSLAVNPYTGEELGSLASANPFPRTLHQFHTNLLLGPAGKLITATAAIFLLGLSLSGLVLWWPRRLWKMSSSKAGRQTNFELHNVAGLYASVFMLLFALTAIVIHWDDPARQMVNRLAGQSDAPPAAKVDPATGNAPLLSPDELCAKAANAVPGARVTGLLNLNVRQNPVRVAMKFPEDRTPLGRTNLYLDPVSGRVLSAQTSRTGSLGLRLVKLWNREIHTGDIAGWPTRLLACAASLSLPLLAITGPLIWWRRMRRRKGTG